MKAILTYIAFAAMAGTALAQTEQRPANDPLSVKPIASQAQTTDTDMIRSKIERMGYTDVVDLSRDSMGVWHARAKKGTETLDVIVDKDECVFPMVPAGGANTDMILALPTREVKEKAAKSQTGF